MTTDHESDPDATVKMPRPTVPKDADLENADPDSTLIREDWGSAAILPPPNPNATPTETQLPEAPQQKWDRTLRRPAHSPKQESR